MEFPMDNIYNTYNTVDYIYNIYNICNIYNLSVTCVICIISITVYNPLSNCIISVMDIIINGYNIIIDKILDDM